MELNITRNVVRKSPDLWDCINDGKKYIMVTSLFMYGYTDRICYLDESGNEMELNCDDFKYGRTTREIPRVGKRVYVELYYRSDEPLDFVFYYALPQDNKEYYGISGE